MGLVGILIIINIPLFFLLGRFFFKTWSNFYECLKFWITPEVFSLFRGEYFEDIWAELKLAVYVGSCAALVYAEHQIFF